MLRTDSPRHPSRLRVTIIGAAALLAAAVAPAAAQPPIDSGSAAPAAQTVNLNDYCTTPGATATLNSGRDVFCTRVDGTDSYVWSYTQHTLAHDPNQRGYTCGADGCQFPDGSAVPGYQRCGILCGEPPTSGDVQSGLATCFNAGTPFTECENRVYGN